MLLFMAERDERVDPRRAVRGEKRRERRHDGEQGSDANEGRRIERCQTEQQAAERARHRRGARQAKPDTHTGECQARAEHEAQHVRPLRAKGPTDSISVTRRFTVYKVTPYSPSAAMTSASAPKNPDSIATSRSCRTDACT